MRNAVHVRLIREFMGDGLSICVIDPEFHDRVVFKPSPRNFRAAIKEIEAVAGGLPFDVLDPKGERIGTVYTAIGNGPDETVADWSSPDHPLADTFTATCERIVCP